MARPRWAARTFELTLEEVGVRLSSGLLLPGEDLKRHLAGCRRAVLFCATLSAQADALIRRAEKRDMLRALALDCCATAAVEQLCDQIELELQRQFPGCFFPFRYSPGYGDLPPPSRAACWPCWTPTAGGAVRQCQPYPYPAQVGDRHSWGSRPPHSTSVRSCLGCPAHDSCQYRKSGGHCGIS